MKSLDVDLRGAECQPGEDPQVEVLSAWNLIMLQSFYEVSNHTISGQSLIPPQRVSAIAPIDTPLLRENISRILSADKEASFSLRQVVKTLHSSEPVLHSPSEAMIMDFLLTTSQNWSKASHSIALVVITVVVFFLGLWVLRLNRRLTLTHALVLAAAAIPQARS